jgi:hypothetical protein
MDILKYFEWAANLPVVPKIILSVLLITVAAFAIVVMWKSPSPPPVALPAHTTSAATRGWPENRTLEGLQKTLQDVSQKDAQLLKVVATSNNFGLYQIDISNRLGWSIDEVGLRAKILESQGLLEVRAATTLNIRLNPDLNSLQGAKQLINALP